jgi:hypothetical protein
LLLRDLYYFVYSKCSGYFGVNLSAVHCPHGLRGKQKADDPRQSNTPVPKDNVGFKELLLLT